jgi:hypothetical protein
VAVPSINKPIHQGGFHLRKVGRTSGEERISVNHSIFSPSHGVKGSYTLVRPLTPQGISSYTFFKISGVVKTDTT